MKSTIFRVILLPVIALLALACKDEQKYTPAIVEGFNLTLDGTEWRLNTGLSTKPIFIYKDNGEYFANYSSHFRFSLDEGGYILVATPDPTNMIPNDIISTNLNDVVIGQFPTADRSVQISDATAYSSPFKGMLPLAMKSRTGTLRLRATDTKADMSYSSVRATLSVLRSGYKISEAIYISEPVDLVKTKATSTGGINYTDDFIVFETGSADEISVKFEFIRPNGDVSHSKTIESGEIEVLPGALTLVEFQLNDTESPSIQNYTVTIVDEDWTDETLTPAPPFYVPPGYTYVSPAENLASVYNAQMADPSISEVKLYLKSGETYALGRPSDVTKSVSILAENPKPGVARTILNLGSFRTITGDATGNVPSIEFSGVDIVIGDAYLFDNIGTPFTAGTIRFHNCAVNNLGRSLYRGGVAATTNLQTIDNFIIDDCKFMNLEPADNYGFISMSAGNVVKNITITNSTIHTRGTGLRNSFIGGTNSQTGCGPMTVTVTNNTIVHFGNTNFTMFDLRAQDANQISVTIKDNLFSGIAPAGQGRWLYLNVAGRTITGNYATSDFTPNTWGVEETEIPTATVTKDELFTDWSNADVNLVNLTIKDKTSAVYTNRVGDPRWLAE